MYLWLNKMYLWLNKDIPVVEQGKSWVDGGANESRLCAFLTRLRHHLELGYLVRVELEHLKVFKFNSVLIMFSEQQFSSIVN